MSDMLQNVTHTHSNKVSAANLKNRPLFTPPPPEKKQKTPPLSFTQKIKGFQYV